MRSTFASALSPNSMDGLVLGRKLSFCQKASICLMEQHTTLKPYAIFQQIGGNGHVLARVFEIISNVVYASRHRDDYAFLFGG